MAGESFFFQKAWLIVTLLAFSLAHSRAQQPAATDNGGLRPVSDDANPTPGPRRITRVETFLNQGDFDRLDETAAKLRADKSRQPGGIWRLQTLYGELNPRTTDEQLLVEHRKHLEAWVQQKPASITARIALAEFYTDYAWVARGNKEVDQVPESAWPLFRERARKAEDILHQAQKLDEKCPEWFAAMQTVALALDWDKARTRKLFDQATAFEPDYPSYDERYANYLLPKWDGNEHDSIDFAKQAADKLGGDRGDMMYFLIATVLVKKGNEGFRPALDWPRIQRGYTAIETTYGTSSGQRNRYAFIAVRYHDAATAQKVFTVIGDKWSVTVWRTRAAFDRARTWANAAG